MSQTASNWQVRRVMRDELVCWQLQTEQASVLIAEQGAQVLEFQLKNQQPIVWLSEQAQYQKGQPVRGGIPLCWPWFGDLKRNPITVQSMHQQADLAPFHGAARNLDWQLDEISHTTDQPSLTLLLSEPVIADWPHPVSVRCTFSLKQDRLTLTLSTHNHSNKTLHLSQALHTYLAISDIQRVQVEGLAGCRYIETLENWQERQQEGLLSFQGETDRIYQDVPPVIRLLDFGWQRQLCLKAERSKSAVVWNPWANKARRLSQFAEHAWQHMLCIETANVWDDCIQLPAGQQAQLTLSLWSEPLS